MAESHYVLLSTAAITLVVWYLSGLVSRQLYLPLALFGVSTYLMMELNNSNALIRIYSRMVSCSFMILACTALPLFQSLDTALVTLCFITFLLAAFNSYQDKQAVGWIFYAFLALSIASTIFPQVLFFIPFIWLFMAYLLMTFSVRTFGASLIGLLTPYSFILPVCVLTDHMDFFDNLYCQFTDFRPILFMHSQQESMLAAIGDRVNVVLLFSFIFVTICAIIGTVHFLRNSFRDKIRTRMFYNIFIYFNLIILLFILLQPQHFHFLLCMMIVTTSPLIGHFVALTKTRATNVLFCLLLIAVVGITLFHLLPPTLFSLPSWDTLRDGVISNLPEWISSLIS